MILSKAHMADKLAQDHNLDFLRTGFAFVTEHATHVHINESRLKAFAQELPAHNARLQDRYFDPFTHFQPKAEWGNVDEQFYSYVLTLNAANFGSGWREDLRASGFIKQNEGLYYPFARAVTKWFENQRGQITPALLSVISEQEVAAIFGFRNSVDAEAYLTKEFTINLNLLGQHIEAHGGSFTSFVELAEGDAVRFVKLLAAPALTTFTDHAIYKGQTITFLKRAQICVSDIAWKKSVFTDLSELTVFLDDQVPHVLRMAGVLDYDDHLAALVDSEQPLEAGSAEEVELRAVAGHACEMLAQLSGFTARDLDPILWHLGHDKDGLAHPTFRPHRCATTAY